jgi:hypothetical protein
MFFSFGDGGGEEETPGHVLSSLFCRTTRVAKRDKLKRPFLCYILYIEQWGFHYNMCQTITNGVPDSRCSGQTRPMLKFQKPDDLFHSLKTMKGSSAPRSVTDSTDQWVLCLMHMWSMLYVISFICLGLG